MKHLVFQALADAARCGEPVALALISGVKGSSPQKVGAKALFYSDGRIHGTLGGGCLEAEIQQRALQSLRTGQPAPFDLLLDHDFGWDDGLICGGKVLGLILPAATDAGANFWQALANRESIRSWAVTKKYKGDLGRFRTPQIAFRNTLSGNHHAAVQSLDCGRGSHRSSRRAAGRAIGF